MSSARSPSEIASDVDRVVGALRRSAADAFEVRADAKENLTFSRQKGVDKGAKVSRAGALGIRLFAGGGASYVEAQADAASLADAIERGVHLARANGARSWRTFPRVEGSARKASYLPRVKTPPTPESAEEVAEILARVDGAIARSLPGAASVLSFGAATTRTVFADSAGSWVETGSLVSTLYGQASVHQDGRFAEGVDFRAGERGVGDYEDEGGPETLGERIARNAKDELRAIDLPAGRHRTLCDNTLSGLLAHESFGHLTEYDLVASGWSVLRGHLGETLASSLVTIRDAPIAPHGARDGVVVPLDDEGTKGSAATLLDKGVLAGWMHTRDSAASAEHAAVGNGRALDARFPPIVRMRNTFIEPGTSSFDEALAELRDGVYLIGGRGGAPRSDGSFMFTSARGFVVRKGAIEEPVRATAIHGNIFDFLRNVELLTNDFHVTTNFFGGCGKWDQSFLHVGIGGPHVLVSEALLGGQGA